MVILESAFNRQLSIRGDKIIGYLSTYEAELMKSRYYKAAVKMCRKCCGGVGSPRTGIVEATKKFDLPA